MRIGGIEPPTRPWQGRILPLNHIRSRFIVIHNPSNIKILKYCRTKSLNMKDKLIRHLSCLYPHKIPIFIHITVDNYGDMWIRDTHEARP